MSMQMMYIAGIIGVCALITFITRALPFICFGNRKLMPSIDQLAKTLPETIMVILVIYCLKDMTWDKGAKNMPEIMACILIILLQYIRKNMYISIIGGTLCYMILIHIF